MIFKIQIAEDHMEKNPMNLELADLAKDSNGNIIIRFHTATITYSLAELQDAKSKGVPTDFMSCVLGAFVANGKTKDEIMAFMQEAEEANARFQIELDAPNGERLNLDFAADNPLLDQFLQMGVEQNSKDAERQSSKDGDNDEYIYIGELNEFDFDDDDHADDDDFEQFE